MQNIDKNCFESSKNREQFLYLQLGGKSLNKLSLKLVKAKSNVGFTSLLVRAMFARCRNLNTKITRLQPPPPPLGKAVTV